MVLSLRKIEKGLGKEKKIILDKEKNGRFKSRRSIYVNHDLYKNKLIKESDLICRRPALGITPNFFYKIIGRKIKRNIKKNEPLTWKNIF